jgi:hypothetical protein
MAFKVDYFPDATVQYVVLSGTPVDTSSVALDIIGGTAQVFPGDFSVTDSTVYWLDTTNVWDHDKLRVIYDKS